jgi:4,5-DOPA dioxygenase extradiol
MSRRMPALFVGHGNPMNALAANAYTQGWSAIAKALPRPKAIVVVSAHWYAPGTAVTAMERPRTIHDFGGFPPELYRVQYPAPGDPELARQVQGILSALPVDLDTAWGLDHGTWSVLVHMFPEADVPVVQLCMDETQPGPFHLKLGRKLRSLREEGVLVLGSGNLVHNLHSYAWGRHRVEPYEWAVRFELEARELIVNGRDDVLAEYEELGPHALLSAPTPDHFLPLLYVLGLRHPEDTVSFPIEGVDGGSVSMLCVQVG